MIKAPKSIDKADFREDLENPEALYGLPKDINFCKRCVISNQRPNSAIEFKHVKNSRKSTIHFDKEGVCDACIVSDLKAEEVDWKERERELTALLERFQAVTAVTIA